MNALYGFILVRASVAKSVKRRLHAARRVALLTIAATFFFSAFAVFGHPQTDSQANYSRQRLIDLARQMREKKHNTGDDQKAAIEQHLDPVTVLAVRTTSGRAELHATSADAFFVVDGHATLITGGKIINPQGTEEVRGDSIQGGVHTELRVGDVVHIPANTPHQLLLDGPEPFVYVLIKVLLR